MAAPRRELFGFLKFSLLAALVGIIAGLGAALFRALIALIHNAMFLGVISVYYDANTHTPASPWGAGVILVPVIGAIGVALLVSNFAMEAKGHGVPEVMDAIYYNRGVIRPVVALVKSLASALSIGSGGSVGREGPIIQIGSSFGSTVGQIMRLPSWQVVTLIASGAGAGIAATFNTPVGGVLFALEIMMHEVSARTLVPVAIATATATYIGRICFGPHPSFVIPALERPYFHVASPWLLAGYAGLGVIMGILSLVFIRSIYACEDLFTKRVRGGYYVQHVLGMLLVGILMYVAMQTLGHYYVSGVGYATIQDILSGAQTGPALLVLLFGLKLLATSLTLGSGASGGIFSPALFLGATAGGAYSILLERVFPALAISPPAFAVAGMAGMVGGTTGAAMAAIVMIFEMTLDYNVIVPMTITVALSYGVRQALSRQNIYTLKLVRRGHYMPEALQTNLHFLKPAHTLLDAHFETLPASMTLGDFSRKIAAGDAASAYLVGDGGRVTGVLMPADGLSAAHRLGLEATVQQAASSCFVVVSPDATLMDVVAALRSKKATVALVAEDGQAEEGLGIAGTISKNQILDAMADAVELFY